MLYYFHVEKAMTPHSSTLAWKIPLMEEPGVRGVAKSWTWLSDFTVTFHFHALEKEMATHSSVLAWRIPGKAEPGGLPSMGSHRVGHDWSDLAAASFSKTDTWKGIWGCVHSHEQIKECVWLNDSCTILYLIVQNISLQFLEAVPLSVLHVAFI